MKIGGIIVRRRWVVGTREGRKEMERRVGGERRERVMEGSEE